MTDLEHIAEETCREFLSAADLKEVCARRGFSPPAADKDALASFVAPRLLESTGVQEAMSSLDEKGRLLLHEIALWPTPTPVTLRDLCPLLGGREWNCGRAEFRIVVDLLVNRGVVLVHDPEGAERSGKSRFARLAFLLPDAHRALLPPFPVPTSPLGDTVPPRDPARLLREALCAAVFDRAPERKGLLSKAASLVSLKDGHLIVGGSAPGDAFLARVRASWAVGPFRVALHVLSSLPAGAGCTSSALCDGLKLLQEKASKSQVDRWCEEGVEAGFLVRAAASPLFAVAPPHEWGRGLACSPVEEGVLVDLEQTDLAPLLELAMVCGVEPRGGALALTPDRVRMGRLHGKLADVQALAAVRAVSPPFDRAARFVEGQVGKVLLHQGLAVLRVDDDGLRALLGHRLGDRHWPLGGPYLAIPRGAVAELEEILRKEGFSPRRVS